MTKKPPANPVKPGDADAFAIFVHKWQRELNLMDWRIVQSPKRAKGSCAEVVKRDLPAKLATYRIGEHFGAEPVTELSVERTVVHELLHIFLYELLEAAKDANNVSQETLEGLEHSVINVLERLLVPEGD
jgi:hypothetical protein